MKKIIWLKIFLTSFCLLFIFGLNANALNLNDAFKVTDNSSKDPLDTLASKAGYNTAQTNLNQIVGNVIQTVLGLLGIIFLLLIIYGGVIWMTAQGEEAKVEKAQRIIRNAVIGLIIVISAYAISYFIINAIGQRTLAQ